jgi:hypothetical protein
MLQDEAAPPFKEENKLKTVGADQHNFSGFTDSPLPCNHTRGALVQVYI